MRKIHYELLHKVAERLDAKPLSYQRTVPTMESDPDAYLASLLERLVDGLKPGGWLEEDVDSAKYEGYMKKMRKLLGQESKEHESAHGEH